MFNSVILFFSLLATDPDIFFLSGGWAFAFCSFNLFVFVVLKQGSYHLVSLFLCGRALCLIVAPAPVLPTASCRLLARDGLCPDDLSLN